MYQSINFYDWQTILRLFEAIAWAAVVGLAVLFALYAKTNKLLTKQNQQIALMVFAAWAIASIGSAAIETYSYFSSTRDTIVQSIEQQKQIDRN